MRGLKLAARVAVGIVGAGLMIHVLAAAVILREIATQDATRPQPVVPGDPAR